jgi:D-aminopeptidase
MKLYVHWDMEGTSGLFTREHTWSWEEGVRPEIAEEGRRLLMADVSSAGTWNGPTSGSMGRVWARSASRPALRATFGVPLLLVQGDEAGCREAEAQFPGVVMAPVKHAISHDLCAGLDAMSARRFTAQKVAEAIEIYRRAPIKLPAPYRPSLPMQVTVRMHTIAGADAAAAKPHARRVDEHTVEWLVERQCDVVRWLANAGLE